MTAPRDGYSPSHTLTLLCCAARRLWRWCRLVSTSALPEASDTHDTSAEKRKDDSDYSHILDVNSRTDVVMWDLTRRTSGRFFSRAFPPPEQTGNRAERSGFKRRRGDVRGVTVSNLFSNHAYTGSSQHPAVDSFTMTAWRRGFYSQHRKTTARVFRPFLELDDGNYKSLRSKTLQSFQKFCSGLKTCVFKMSPSLAHSLSLYIVAWYKQKLFPVESGTCRSVWWSPVGEISLNGVSLSECSWSPSSSSSSSSPLPRRNSAPTGPDTQPAASRSRLGNEEDALEVMVMTERRGVELKLGKSAEAALRPKV